MHSSGTRDHDAYRDRGHRSDRPRDSSGSGILGFDARPTRECGALQAGPSMGSMGLGRGRVVRAPTGPTKRITVLRVSGKPARSVFRTRNLRAAGPSQSGLSQPGRIQCGRPRRSMVGPHGNPVNQPGNGGGAGANHWEYLCNFGGPYAFLLERFFGTAAITGLSLTRVLRASIEEVKQFFRIIGDDAVHFRGDELLPNAFFIGGPRNDFHIHGVQILNDFGIHQIEVG